MFKKISAMIRSLFYRSHVEQELDQELNFHLEMAIKQKVSSGLSPAEARRAALVEFGGIEQKKEECRQIRPGGLLDTFWQDLRHSLRLLRKNPGFAAVAVSSLALGIGANTAIFSLVDKILLRSLAIKSPAQIVQVTSDIFSYPDYVDCRDQNQVFAGLTAYSTYESKLGAETDTQKVMVGMVDANYFDLLGVNALRGRMFLSQEGRIEGAPPAVVLGYGLWQRAYGGDPAMVGRTIILNGKSFTVIGIAPASFTGMDLERPTEIWLPLVMIPQVQSSEALKNRDDPWLHLIGRLKPGIGLTGAQAGLNVLVKQIKEANTPISSGKSPGQVKQITLEPAGQGNSSLRLKFGSILVLLMAIVGLLLLIACANVATLLLARATVRRNEIAVRMALGASRSRLMRQLVTESLVLSLFGGGLGLLIAPWLHRLILAFQPYAKLETAPVSQSLDLRVLCFSLLISVAAGIVFGLAPAWQTTRLDLIPAIKGSELGLNHGERRFTVRNGLVVTQVALALIVLIGSGLFLRSLHNLFSIDPGFKADNLLLVPVELPDAVYRGRREAVMAQLTERIKSAPGVVGASVAFLAPFTKFLHPTPILIEGVEAKSGATIEADIDRVGPGYHEMMGIPIRQGRGFNESDRDGAPRTAVINDALARSYFPNQNPIGKHISTGAGKPWLEIIGVAGNVKVQDLTETAVPHFDVPILQTHYGAFTYLIVRTNGKPTNLVPSLRHEIQSIDPGILSSRVEIRSLDELLSNTIAGARMATMLTTMFAGAALLLAIIGLYGIIAYSVNRRTREIGIRIALGAQTGDVLKLVVGHGMGLVVIGLIIGLAGSFALTRLITNQLYDVSPTDKLTFGVVSLVLVIVAFLACLAPARRAAKVDPMVALRYE